MLKKTICSFCIGLMAVFFTISAHAHGSYGKKYCKLTNYTCVKVKRGDTWASLFPNAQQREIVRKVNRMNIGLRTGMTIAIPKNLSRITLLDVAPLPKKISPPKGKKIKVSLNQLAWGAYDANGHLINWGPISGGKKYCADVKRGCKTISGTFKVYRKQGAGCKSSKYPLGKGGAKMPYCMHFYRGFAMHGSNTVPGHHASHGCVRLFVSDARWLNQKFIQIGTRVVIR